MFQDLSIYFGEYNVVIIDRKDDELQNKTQVVTSFPMKETQTVIPWKSLLLIVNYIAFVEQLATT